MGAARHGTAFGGHSAAVRARRSVGIHVYASFVPVPLQVYVVALVVLDLLVAVAAAPVRAASHHVVRGVRHSSSVPLLRALPHVRRQAVRAE
ncbi:hypothetical protein AB0C76_18090 [Kitasatospora sp. NPDC048722]|uniref:hypothetical protein n=1 Tax=Kitasatospora sp. NPDC048722 TaxID=3155639 RepID=UPI0033E3DA2C